MKTNSIMILTILTLGGLVMNPAAFSAQLPHRPLPVPAVRSTPVPRPVVTPTPAPVPPAVASLVISYETSASSNIAITVSAGQAGAPAGFSIQWMTLADYIALGNRWPLTSEVPNPQASSFCKATFGVPVTPNCAGYNLRPWQSVAFSIGDDSLYDNGLLILVHQLIAAKLNIANGADPSAVQHAITDADNMIGALVVPPIGNGYLAPGQTGDLVETLTQYNEGTIGPGHCND